MSTKVISPRQARIIRHTMWKFEPEYHNECKKQRRIIRTNQRKLNAARVAWARKLWVTMRKAKGLPMGTFPGALTPSPRTSYKWSKRWTKQTTRVISPKVARASTSTRLGQAQHKRKFIDRAPRNGDHALLRKLQEALS